MNNAQLVAATAATLILARGFAELGLSMLNCRHVRARAGAVPEAFKGAVDDVTYTKSVQYTLARNRFGQFGDIYNTCILLSVLFSGVLPWAFGFSQQYLGASPPAQAAFLLAAGLVLSLPGLPVDWFEQFWLEAKFGFNTTTPKTWCFDRLKGLLLAVLLGYPLLLLVLKLMEWTGAAWWLWAWAALLGFQLLMMVLAPVLILPLFNKFTPLAEGSLRDRLLALAERTRFRARSIHVMDGSKRSRHSNAFFTGLGRFRKIVLFDTLIAQLSEPELEAVLAHEIGHYKLRHIVKLLVGSALGSLAGFYVLAALVKQSGFYRAFGFEPGDVTPALLLFAMLAGAATFWLSPLLHAWSRRHEYQADAFAKHTLGEAQPLVTALRKLNEKNLGNLTPHPLYSGFYYSHPTLLEREQALAK